MNKYKAFLLEKEANEKEKSRRISSDTIKTVKENIPDIVKKYPLIQKIIVFGSAVNKSMNEFSDVDIYIEGINPAQYWELLGALSNRLHRTVDLLTPDDDPYFTSIIKKYGEVLYERED